MPSSFLYFIAILTPEPIASQVKEWKILMREKYGAKAALKSPAHITMVPPFLMDSSKESALASSLDEFAAKQKSFPIELKNFDAFGQRVLFVAVVDNPFLKLMHEQLQSFFASGEFKEIKREDRPFHPHVTLATRDLERRHFKSGKAEFDGISYEVSFRASALVLLRNTPGRWDVLHESSFANI